METNQNFIKYGNRTSSLISLYPHFSSYKNQSIDGEIRYIEKRKVIGIATEPLTAKENKKDLILNFINDKNFKGKPKVIFPISQQLARELSAAGLNTWQIGIEPIFNLKDYFETPIDPLYATPIAKSLKRRGAQVFELIDNEIEVNKNILEEIKEEWLSQKKIDPLEFLNIVSPFEKDEFKRYFIIKDRGIISAFLTASPIYLNQQVIGYFFNDIIRKKRVRSGTNELLIIEAMRKLYQEGIWEVRLGLCPLAEIDPSEPDAELLTKIFNKWKIGYNFKSLYEFKTKLKPTKIRPLYLASEKKKIASVLFDIVKLHTTENFFKNFFTRTWYEYKQNLKLKDHVQNFVQPRARNFTDVIYRLKFSIALFCTFIGLHFLKNNTAIGKTWFEASAFIPGQVTLEGLIIGPLFHNHAFHLIGDQLSFIIFAGSLEFVFGPFVMLTVTAIGLWASNPVTHAILASTLKFISTNWWEKVLIEKDYGSSNAVFALVGTALYVLKRNAWLFIPFLFHALYVCFQRESFLAIHHLVGIYLGYVAGIWFFTKRKIPN